jgi:hypothetical protein
MVDGHPHAEILLTNQAGEVVTTWPARVILRALGIVAGELRAEYATGEHRRHPSRQESEAWIAATRAFAERLPYGGPIVAEMRAVAGRLEALLNTPAAETGARPRSPREELDYRLNLIIFAYREMTAAFRLPRRAAWKSLRRVLEAVSDAGTLSDEALTHRAQGIAERLTADARIALLESTLDDLVKYGPLTDQRT